MFTARKFSAKLKRLRGATNLKMAEQHEMMIQIYTESGQGPKTQMKFVSLLKVS
jgi:hypothetical protein